MTTLEIRNVPADEIRRLLTGQFGGSVDGDVVNGDGWRVVLREGLPVFFGQTRVSVLFLNIEGDREADATAFLRKSTMRGGG